MLMVWPGSIGPVVTPRPGLPLFGPPKPTGGVPMKVGLPLDQEMHWPSLREPTHARQVPVAEVVDVLESVNATRAGTAAAATARAPKAAIRRARVFAVVITGLSLETVSTLTIP